MAQAPQFGDRAMHENREKEIKDVMKNHQPVSQEKDKKPVISNHTGYGYGGSENFEHDDTGSIMNYSGVEDEVNQALSDHEGWQEDYDY